MLVKQVNRRIPRANGLFDAEDARDDDIEDVEIETSDDEEGEEDDEEGASAARCSEPLLAPALTMAALSFSLSSATIGRLKKAGLTE